MSIDEIWAVLLGLLNLQETIIGTLADLAPGEKAFDALMKLGMEDLQIIFNAYGYLYATFIIIGLLLFGFRAITSIGDDELMASFGLMRSQGMKLDVVRDIFANFGQRSLISATSILMWSVEVVIYPIIYILVAKFTFGVGMKLMGGQIGSAAIIRGLFTNPFMTASLILHEVTIFAILMTLASLLLLLGLFAIPIVRAGVRWGSVLAKGAENILKVNLIVPLILGSFFVAANILNSYGHELWAEAAIIGSVLAIILMFTGATFDALIRFLVALIVFVMTKMGFTAGSFAKMVGIEGTKAAAGLEVARIAVTGAKRRLPPPTKIKIE